MTDEPESVEGEDEIEWEADVPLYPDTLHAGQAFFYPDLGTFCEEHGAKAISVDETGVIWVYQNTGGDAVSLGSFKKARPNSLHSIKPADGTH